MGIFRILITLPFSCKPMKMLHSPHPNKQKDYRNYDIAHIKATLFHLRPTVLQRTGTVEDKMVGGAVAVGAEVAHTLELVADDAVFPILNVGL